MPATWRDGRAMRSTCPAEPACATRPAVTNDYKDLRFEIDGGVALITLDRADKLNAFTGDMGAALEAAYRHCDEDDEVRAVIVTGAGRAFCAGADMSGGATTF